MKEAEKMSLHLIKTCVKVTEKEIYIMLNLL